VSYETWLRSATSTSAAQRPGKDLAWLIQRFESLPKTDKERAELYDSQKLYVRWTPAYRSTRTGMRLPATRVYYHQGPLIQRRDISLDRELETPATKLKQLSPKQGEAI